MNKQQVRFAWFRDETDKAVFFEVGVRYLTEPIPGFDDGKDWQDAILPLWLPKSQVETDSNHDRLYITSWIAEKKEEEIAKEYGYKCCEIVLEEEQAGGSNDG